MAHSLKSLDPSDIMPVMEKATLFGGKIAQPTLTSNLTATIKRIDVDPSGNIIIKLFEEISFEPDRHISIKLNYRHLFFHIEPNQYTFEGNTIFTRIPKSAKALTIRDTERYVMPTNSHLTSSIHRIEKRGISCNVEAHIVDVSSHGLGLLLSNSEEGMLVLHDHIWIRSINKMTLDKPIFGKVVYVQQRKFKDTLDTKVGISLEDSVPEDILNELKQLSHFILSA